MNILFLTPYPYGKAPSQRFRFEQYFNALEKQGYQMDTQPFWDEQVWPHLYIEGRVLKKISGLIRGYLRRIAVLFKLARYDYVFVHREIAPVGPPLLAFLIARVFNKKIIFDFDDAIWLPNYAEANKFFALFKFYSNTNYLCKLSYKVSCGNHYLCNYAKQSNSNVVYNPTTIDTENYHTGVKEKPNDIFIIGWTGSHSTVRYLQELEPVFKKLEEKYTFELRVISDQPPTLSIRSLRFIKWNKSTEITDLMKFDIGLMPLINDPWAQGKCGFKALQYMALGIPALVSSVGVNNQIVDDGINGFICTTPAEWYDRIELLLNNPERLKTIAQATRKKIVSHYSVNSNTANFISLFS